MSLTELAQANGIGVVLASLTPVCECFTLQTEQRPPGKIIGMNAWLQDYAAESGFVDLDYYSALAEGRTLKKEFTTDGFLLNDAAHNVMAPLAERAVAKALGRK